jgi:hypothetical protein
MKAQVENNNSTWVFYYYLRILANPNNRSLIMESILIEIASASRRRWPNRPLRIWYVKLADNKWKVVVFNPTNKVILKKGPEAKTPTLALIAMRDSLSPVARKAE